MSAWGAIGSAVGNIVGAVASPIIQGEYNKDQAEDSRAWSDEMRSTAYQDTMKDMHAAGLNPILAYKTGSSSAPSGATASISAPNLSQLGSSALDAYQREKQIELTDKQIDKTVEESYLTRSQTEKNYQEAHKLEWENRIAPLTYSSALEQRLMEAQKFSRQKEIETLKTKLTPKADKVLKFIDDLLDTGKSVWDERVKNNDRY